MPWPLPLHCLEQRRLLNLAARRHWGFEAKPPKFRPTRLAKVSDSFLISITRVGVESQRLVTPMSIVKAWVRRFRAQQSPEHNDRDAEHHSQSNYSSSHANTPPIVRNFKSTYLTSITSRAGVSCACSKVVLPAPLSYKGDL